MSQLTSAPDGATPHPASNHVDVQDVVVQFTVFRDQGAKEKTWHSMTLAQLRAGILEMHWPDKDKLPFLKLARFGDKATAAGCLRYDANMLEVTGIELDYDRKRMSLVEAGEVIARLNLKCLLYTTPSYTEAEPKWRILCPTSRPLPPSERERLARGVDALFGNIFAVESFTLSQSYYFGSVSTNGDTNPAHSSQLFDGDFVDEMDLPLVEVRAPPLQAGTAPESEPQAQQGNTVNWNAEEERRLRAALDLIPTDEKTLTEKLGSSHAVFVNIGRALERLSWGEQGFAIWRDWCKRNPEKFNEDGLRKQWRSFTSHRDDPGPKVTVGTIYAYAERCNVFPYDNDGPIAHDVPPKDPPPKDPPINNAPAFSEEAIAVDFANRHADSLRYVSKWGQWYRWDGACWRTDEKRAVFTIARGICRETAVRCNKPSECKRIASAKTRAAVVSLAGEDPRLAAVVDQWDTDPWLLCTPDGVVDLRTGVMRAHRPEDYVTKMAAVSPGGACPKWKKFLKEVTGGDEELQAYLQRVGGYCLTGVTREQELYFFYGTGRNGKSVFLRTVATILGDYHRASSIETFTVSQSERHPTEVAGLRGARLVTATETEDGRRWAEARIKELTGGDKVTARFMRQDFFDFTPQFKLMFSGNHMPALRTVNQAISRRFRRVPFTVTIPEDQVNVRLADELMEEASGILQWLVDGCLAWQREGLKPPKAVAEATQSYFDSQDVFGDWLAECCDVGVNYTEASAGLFHEWKYWAEARNEFVGSKKAFGQKLEDHGFVSRRDGRARRFSGLRVKP